MAGHFEVTSYERATRDDGSPDEWSNTYGTYHVYKIGLRAPGTQNASNTAQINRKVDENGATKATNVGETIYGTLTETGRGWKFKQEQEPDGAASPAVSTSPTGTSVYTNNSGGMTLDRELKIVRQHSQSMALQWAAILQSQSRLADSFGLDDLKQMVDWFDNDVVGAA